MDSVVKVRYDVMAMADYVATSDVRLMSVVGWDGMGKTALTSRVLADVDIVRTVAVFREGGVPGGVDQRRGRLVSSPVRLDWRTRSRSCARLDGA